LFFAFGERVGGVAVGATEVAGGEADENAGQAGEGALTLQAQVDFVDVECLGHESKVIRIQPSRTGFFRGGGNASARAGAEIGVPALVSVSGWDGGRIVAYPLPYDPAPSGTTEVDDEGFAVGGKWWEMSLASWLMAAEDRGKAPSPLRSASTLQV